MLMVKSRTLVIGALHLLFRSDWLRLRGRILVFDDMIDTGVGRGLLKLFLLLRIADDAFFGELLNCFFYFLVHVMFLLNLITILIRVLGLRVS